VPFLGVAFQVSQRCKLKNSCFLAFFGKINSGENTQQTGENTQQTGEKTRTSIFMVFSNNEIKKNEF